MDKYTVDLDKVLNDFEYSEYSLESSKVHRNIPNENPNTSVSTNHHYSRNDTSVKHSINNVFQSLNEYLSSDITPKKVDNIHINYNGEEYSNRGQLVSALPLKPETIGHQEVLPQTLDGPSQIFLVPSDFNEIQPVTNESSECEKENFKTETLEDKTNTNSNNCAINLNQECPDLKSETETFNVGIPILNILDNKSDLIDMPDNEMYLSHIQNQTTYTEPSEEILVDLSRTDSCNINITKNDPQAQEANEKETIVIASTELKEMVSENDAKSKSNEDPEVEVQENSYNYEYESKTNNSSDQKGIELNEGLELNENSIAPAVVEKSSVLEKIGFDNDVELDEENIEQYFQELEEELGIKEHDGKEKLGVDSNMENVITQVLENLITEENKQEIISELKCEEKEQSASFSGEEREQSSQEKNDLNQSESNTKEEIVSYKNNETDDSSLRDSGDVENLEHPEENSEKTANEKKPENDLELTPESGSQAGGDSKECVKNSRPQILPLSEEAQETPRKIDLIGEPGSTPYNNLYSTKDFSKTLSTSDREQSEKRATSPSYSDVSTDSVSSSSSGDTTEYNDAVSEEPNEKSEKQEDGSKETVQNNLVHQIETSRSDVTMDKDFKNNLKMSNVRSEDGPSTSCAQSDENGGMSLDDREPEGACALFTEQSQEISKEDGEQTNIGESNSASGMDWLGKQAPLWIPDSEAMSCLQCDMKFTVIKRRHHCRACGLVLCAKCCSRRYRLEYLNAEARVCIKCFEILERDTNSNSGSEFSQESSSPSRNLNAAQGGLGQPNPNNPLEYCSTIPPNQQVDAGAVAVPSVMVPVGVLKRKGSNKGRSNKSVMFCDGIRPGSDLTNLDTDFNYSENQKSEKQRKSTEKTFMKTGRNLDMIDSDTKSFIPSDETSLPPTVTIFKTDMKYSPCVNDSSLVEMLKNESLTFALQSNVFVHVKIINMDCCVSRIAWCFSTEGLINVGQDEIVILLEFIENESLVPKDIFVHLNNVYLEAVKGSSVKELGMSLHSNTTFLGSKNHSGFIYIRPSFQCLQNVILPKEPYLIGILIHRWETPWAKLFPLRLILRLGAEYKYYPSPIISTRERDSVFVEIGHTIINLLADFRNYSYTLPQIRGLTIHMEDKSTTVTIPTNRYDQVVKSLSNSSDHILAFAGNFSSVADSHLVCIQDTQGATNSYSTHAINICNQPRKVTGASFIVFNGALKSTSGLTAKSNIVEDGLMIQILPEHMLQVRDSLKNMRNHTIKCGCVNEESDETVMIEWGDPDMSFNIGVLSPIDNKVLTGIPSMRVHNGKDYTCNSGNRLIRWTEVFISQDGDASSKNQESVDISKISESISKATCQALVKYLDLLVSNSFYKIGLRTHIHVENVSYLAGSNNVKLPPIYMKSLDNELIPVLHRIASNNATEQPMILELIFRILNI